MGSKCYLFDLNGTLIFRSTSRKIYLRPGASRLLKSLSSKGHSIYIATSMIRSNALKALTLLDPKWNTYIKDIFDRTYTLAMPSDELPFGTTRDIRKIATKLNRPLEDLVFVDDDIYKYEAYIDTPIQLILVSTFDGSAEDSGLNTVFDF